MLMHSLELRLADTNVSVFSIHNGAIDALIKKNDDDLTTWGSIYSIGRSLGKPPPPTPTPTRDWCSIYQEFDHVVRSTLCSALFISYHDTRQTHTVQ